MSGPSFYKNVVALNRELHQKLRVVTDPRMHFAAQTHLVPLAAVEFFDAALDYPIIFAGDKDPTPFAVLGLRPGQNLFVNAEGRWAEPAYVPAFVRQYPFMLARTGQSSEFAVCMDESYDGLSETEGTPLFDEEGKESELVGQVVKLLQEYLKETERTRRFTDRLVELGLLELQSLQVHDRSGLQYTFRDFRAVAETKLKELEDDVIVKLHRSGYLGCIYAHLASMNQFSRLTSRVPAEPAEEVMGNAG